MFCSVPINPLLFCVIFYFVSLCSVVLCHFLLRSGRGLCTVLFCFVLFHPLISLHFILCHVISYHVISYHYLHSVCPRTVPRTHLTLESIPCVWMPIRRGKGREGQGRTQQWEKGKKRERETDKRKGSGGERREQHIDWMDLCQPPQIILFSPFPSLPFPSPSLSFPFLSFHPFGSLQWVFYLNYPIRYYISYSLLFFRSHNSAMQI